MLDKKVFSKGYEKGWQDALDFAFGVIEADTRLTTERELNARMHDMEEEFGIHE